MVLGHFGDRLGRKQILLITLLIMGLASLAIGFLPTYAQIGYWAPVLLVLCRLAQGFSAGGEAAGASTLTLEHSPEGRRGFFTSFTMTGYAAGMVLATLVFIPVAALPRGALIAGAGGCRSGSPSWCWPSPTGCGQAGRDAGLRRGAGADQVPQLPALRGADAPSGRTCCGWRAARCSR